MFLNALLVSGCFTPALKDSRGVNSPILNAYQASFPVEEVSPWSLPLTPEAQSYAITGGVLVLMVLMILKSSQFKDKQ